MGCEASLRLDQYIRFSGNPQAIIIYNQNLAECDLLIIYKDVCPSHNNGFKVYDKPMVYQYLAERGLQSLKAHMEWKFQTQEELAAADALLRNAINRLR